VAGAQSCVGPPREEGPSDDDREAIVPDADIIAAQEELTATVMPLPGVVGTAVGLCDGSPCIQVFLAAPDAALEARIPDRFRGYSVDVRVTGEIRARDSGDSAPE
jgi:hypothetical protein